jgi:hypothetical protein
LRNTDIFSLDFTTPESLEMFEMQDQLHRVAALTNEAMQILQDTLDRGCSEESAWRMLASLYLGTGNIPAFNALEQRHEQEFGSTMFRMFRLAKPPRGEHRKVVELPPRITAGSLPPVAEVLAACRSPEGAALDFSRVRGADGPGLQELALFLGQLPDNEDRPELAGIDRFMDSLLRAAESPAGSRLMWDVLFSHQMLMGDEKAFDELAIRFAVKFGVSPPSFDRKKTD